MCRWCHRVGRTERLGRKKIRVHTMRHEISHDAHGAFLRVTCERCGHERTFNEAHSPQRALPIRTILDRSEVWAAPISRPEPEAKRLREPVKPLLPPEVIAVLSRNVLQDGHCSSPRHV
jgi:hypothetical protein